MPQLEYLEDKRLKGIAVTGKELRNKFSQKQIDEALKKQRKKIKPDQMRM